MAKKSSKKIDYKNRAKFLRKFIVLPFKNKSNFNAKQKRFLTNKYKHFKNYNGIRHIKLNKKEIKLLKSKGYATTDKGVFLDDMRDGMGNKLPGSTVRLLKDGITKITYKSKTDIRHDYIYPFDSGEKIKFLQEPFIFVIKLIARISILKENFRIEDLRDPKHSSTIRFQLSAYTNHTDVDLDLLEYFLTRGSGASEGFRDALTGLRFIKYIPIKSPKKRKKRK
jgi:hypothetical protein